MDSDYLKATVGPILAKGIADTVVERPEDPIGYLAEFLLNSVAADKATEDLTKEKATAAAELSAAEAKEAEAKAEADALEEAAKLQTDKEDKRLASLLENAESADAVYSAVLSFARARMGASGYVMLTDLPEKVVPPPPPPPPEPVEGDEAAEAEAPPPEDAEPPEPPPKFAPQLLEYVAATSADEKLLYGKTLGRPAVPEGEDDAPEVKTGVGEGVTFTAIDDFLGGGAKVLHIPQAVENRSVKFWYMPRLGAYACAPFDDFEGDVKGVFAFDTLGLERAFSAAEIALIEDLTARAGSALKRIEDATCQEHHALTSEIVAAYPADPESGAYPAYAAPEEADPLESAEEALKIPAAVLAPLSDAHLKFWQTRRSLPTGVLLVLKGVLALLSPEMAADMPEAPWQTVKSAINGGQLAWGAALFEKMGAAAAGVADGTLGVGAEGESGWEAAAAMVEQLEATPEEGAPPKDGLAAESILSKVMSEWLFAVVAMHAKKVEKDAAAAAAAAAAEEGAAEAPAEAEATE